MSVVYIGPYLILPPGGGHLKPLPQFAIYFLQSVRTPSMISMDDAYLPKIVDIDTYPQPTMTLRNDKTWTVVSTWNDPEEES